MEFLEKIQKSVNSLFDHPYAKPVLFVLLLVLAVYFYRSRKMQFGGAGNESVTEALTTGSDATVTEQPADQKAPVPPTAVVLFYSNHCGHCQVLMPTWDTVASKYQNSPNVMLDKVDCEENPAAGQQFKIEGYPTILKLTKDGGREVYNGPRDAASIEAFVNS